MYVILEFFDQKFDIFKKEIHEKKRIIKFPL